MWVIKHGENNKINLKYNKTLEKISSSRKMKQTHLIRITRKTVIWSRRTISMKREIQNFMD